MEHLRGTDGPASSASCLRSLSSRLVQGLLTLAIAGLQPGGGFSMRRLTLVMGIALSMVAFTGAPALGQTIIDNFSLPVQPAGGTDYLTVTGPIGSSGTFVQSGVDALGGTRIYYGQKTNSDTASFQLGITGTQEYRQVANPVVSGRSKLLYGYSAVNTASLDADNYTAGHTLNNLNLNMSAGTGL